MNASMDMVSVAATRWADFFKGTESETRATTPAYSLLGARMVPEAGTNPLMMST